MRMTKAVYLFVDNSNVWIEGKRVAGKIFGEDKRDAWRLDFGKLLRFVGSGRTVYSARLYGSKPPPNDSVWAKAEQRGFVPTILERNARNKEKGVDAELIMDVMETLTETPTKGILAIAAGDGDYHTVPKRAQKYGWDLEFYFWGHAAQSVRTAVPARFVDLDPHIEKIGRWAVGPSDPDLEVVAY